MKQKLTDEQVEKVREAIKNGELQDIDDTLGDLYLSLSVENNKKKVSFCSLGESFEKANIESVKSFYINLELVNLENYESLAKLAYMEINVLPLSYVLDKGYVIDDDADSFNVLSKLMDLDEIEVYYRYYEYVERKYDLPRVNIGELHTSYVSPEYRGLGIVDFMYKHINDILNEEYNQVIFLLGTYINPFKEQKSLDQIKTENVKYCNGEIDKDLLNAMIKSLEKNGFKNMDRENRYFYKNMFIDDFADVVNEDWLDMFDDEE